jgi:hypothetical protein
MMRELRLFLWARTAWRHGDRGWSLMFALPSLFWWFACLNGFRIAAGWLLKHFSAVNALWVTMSLFYIFVCCVDPQSKRDT